MIPTEICLQQYSFCAIVAFYLDIASYTSDICTILCFKYSFLSYKPWIYSLGVQLVYNFKTSFIVIVDGSCDYW